MSNLRQIGLAAQLYVGDSDDRWVPVGGWNDPAVTPYTSPSGPAPGQPWQGWGLRLQPYVKAAALFHSPWMPLVPMSRHAASYGRARQCGPSSARISHFRR